MIGTPTLPSPSRGRVRVGVRCEIEMDGTKEVKNGLWLKQL